MKEESTQKDEEKGKKMHLKQKPCAPSVLPRTPVCDAVLKSIVLSTQARGTCVGGKIQLSSVFYLRVWEKGKFFSPSPTGNLHINTRVFINKFSFRTYDSRGRNLKSHKLTT